MIGSLTGTVGQLASDSALLDVGGVGYRVFILPSLLTLCRLGEEVTVYTHLHVREDDLTLYGFRTPQELAFFQLLLQAPGVGPKSALGVMTMGTVDVLVRTITQGDAALLMKVSGIGRKIAERIVVELKSRLEREYPVLSSRGTTVHADVIAALEGLGYSGAQAREAVRHLPPDVQDAGEGIRAVLKALDSRVER